jgi:hypothetical protein
MADTPHITNAVFHVLWDGDGDLVEWVIPSRNSDYTFYDRNQAAKRWPPSGPTPFYQMVLAWQACIRTGVVDPKMPLEVFERGAAQIKAVDPDGTPDTVDVTPTRPGPGPG